jgi:hypothetical protein
MKPQQTLSFLALALAAGLSTISAQTPLWSDSKFDDISPSEWNTGPLQGTFLANTGEQLIVTEDFFGPLQTNNPMATHVPAFHGAPASGPLPDGQTLELRADLISASQNDAFAGVAINYSIGGLGNGYMFSKDEDELWLVKFYDSATKLAWLFYANQPLKNKQVTLVLALTRAGTNLNVTTRVLDKDNANSVLFERTVLDTPQADPVLPSGTVKGMIGMADPTGTPWPLLMAPTWIELTLQWGNPQLAPEPRAQLIFDNVEVWQYESPQLTIADSVLLSWPVTTGQFILDSAPSLTGPWAPVAEPWMRTNNGRFEVSVLASASMQFFRLRPTP